MADKQLINERLVDEQNAELARRGATVGHQGSSASLVDVEITDQNGRRIVQLRGRSHNFGRPLLDDFAADVEATNPAEGRA